MSDLNREMSMLSDTGSDQRRMAEYACSKSEEIQGQGPASPMLDTSEYDISK